MTGVRGAAGQVLLRLPATTDVQVETTGLACPNVDRLSRNGLLRESKCHSIQSECHVLVLTVLGATAATAIRSTLLTAVITAGAGGQFREKGL